MVSSFTIELTAIMMVILTICCGRITSRRIIWSDEFDGPAGSAPDPSKWKYDLGGAGWGNQELEFYTDSRENSALDGNGNLKITATKDGAADKTCWYGSCQYTSARLLTNGLRSAKYGRIEARIRVPHGKGVWPAFWMLGNNFNAVGWPACGEIDIMELRGSTPNSVSGTIHGSGYSGGQGVTASTSTSDGRWLSDVHHVYAIDWSTDRISWSLDDVTYATRTPADLPAGTNWAFNQDFFIIMNFAVGGNFDGAPDNNTPFPQTMLVDYVRVYE